MDRGYLVLISDQNEYGLGTIVMSGPPMSGETRALSSGIPMFGFKNSVLSKMVSEMIAAKLKKSCLVLFHIKEEEHQNELIAKAVVDCVKQTLEKVEKNSGK
jgi:hypothetical protein